MLLKLVAVWEKIKKCLTEEIFVGKKVHKSATTLWLTIIFQCVLQKMCTIVFYAEIENFFEEIYHW